MSEYLSVYISADKSIYFHVPYLYVGICKNTSQKHEITHAKYLRPPQPPLSDACSTGTIGE